MVSILCCMRCFSCRGRGKRHNKRAERKREGKQNKADSYKEHEQKVWVEQEIQEWGIHRRAGTEWGQHRSPGLAARAAAATWQLHVYSSLITAFFPQTWNNLHFSTGKLRFAYDKMIPYYRINSLSFILTKLKTTGTD